MRSALAPVQQRWTSGKLQQLIDSFYNFLCNRKLFLFHHRDSVNNVAIFISGFTLAQIKKTVEIINKKVRKKRILHS